MSEPNPFTDSLSQDERSELQHYPIPYKPNDEKQLNRRREIGKKLQEALLNADKTLTNEFRKIYEANPMYLFYGDSKGDEQSTLSRRVYGVCQYEDKTCGVHAVTAHILWVNQVVGGVPTDSLLPLSNWTQVQKRFIENCGLPEAETAAFLDPLGFFFFQMVATR